MTNANQLWDRVRSRIAGDAGDTSSPDLRADGMQALALGSALSTERHVAVIATLVEAHAMEIKDACSALSARVVDIDSLPPVIRHVFDVVWLLKEDEKDAIMAVDDDKLLADALRKVVNEVRAGRVR